MLTRFIVVVNGRLSETEILKTQPFNGFETCFHKAFGAYNFMSAYIVWD